MEPQQDDILIRLESAIADWNAQVTRAHQGLADQIARAKKRFDAVVEDLSGEPAGTTETPHQQIDALTAETAALKQALDERELARKAYVERVALLEEAVGKLREEADQLRWTLAEARKTNAELADSLAALQGELSAARNAAAAVPELRAAAENLRDPLRAAREQAERLETELRLHQAVDAEDAISEQLARARRDREEALQQILSLRSEMDVLQRASSGPAGLQTSGTAREIVLSAFTEEGHKRRIGDILVAAEVVTEEQLRRALAAQETARHRRLGEILVEEGYTAETVIAQVLACQLRAPYVRLSETTVEPGATRLIGERLAIRHSCIPIRATENEVVLVMSNPLDLIAIDDVELATGRRVSPAVATASDIAAAIDRCYGRQ